MIADVAAQLLEHIIDHKEQRPDCAQCRLWHIYLHGSRGDLERFIAVVDYDPVAGQAREILRFWNLQGYR